MPPAFTRSQRGVVLAISLIILLLLTLLALSAMRQTLLEQHMAANLKNHALSFQAAEAALRQGEAWVGGLTEPPPECARAPCSPASVRPAGEPKPPIARDRAWWTHNARAAAAPGGVSHKPRFIVARRAWQPDDRRATCTSYSDACTGRTYFSVAVRATGIDDTAVTILRSVFSKRFR